MNFNFLFYTYTKLFRKRPFSVPKDVKNSKNPKLKENLKLQLQRSLIENIKENENARKNATSKRDIANNQQIRLKSEISTYETNIRNLKKKEIIH